MAMPPRESSSRLKSSLNEIESCRCSEKPHPRSIPQNYYDAGVPVVLKGLAKEWPAYQKWNWDYFKHLVGDKKVGIYNNIKSDATTPVNTSDDYAMLGEYIDMVSQGPAAWRIFLFNIFDHSPGLTRDFVWPEHLLSSFVKRYPMLIIGGKTSITHMHYDIDLSHIMHTRFFGKKRVLLFPYREQHKIYRRPFGVLRWLISAITMMLPTVNSTMVVSRPSEWLRVTILCWSMAIPCLCRPVFAPFGIPRKRVRSKFEGASAILGRKAEGAKEFNGHEHSGYVF